MNARSLYPYTLFQRMFQDLHIHTMCQYNFQVKRHWPLSTDSEKLEKLRAEAKFRIRTRPIMNKRYFFIYTPIRVAGRYAYFAILQISFDSESSP